MRTLILLALSGCMIAAADPPSASGTADPSPNLPSMERGVMREIDIAQFKTDRDAGSVPILFDVRTPGEFADGHVPGAINVPLDQVPDRLADFAPHRSQEVYLICRSGGRSANAGRFLQSHGYKVVNIMGGTMGWQTAGLPIDR